MTRRIWLPSFATLSAATLATIISPDYQGPEELDGVFSGWKEDSQSYVLDSWQYEGMKVPSSLAETHAGRFSTLPYFADIREKASRLAR